MINLRVIVTPTVVSHDAFEGAEVRHLGMVPAEDFGSGTEVVREVLTVSLPHHTVPAQVVDFSMKWYVVRWPIACKMKYTEGGGCLDTLQPKEATLGKSEKPTGRKK